MTIRWNAALLARHMKRHGLTNANQLHAFTGLTVPTAYNVLSGAPLQRVETATLETLARAFGITKPLALLDYTPD